VINSCVRVARLRLTPQISHGITYFPHLPRNLLIIGPIENFKKLNSTIHLTIMQPLAPVITRNRTSSRRQKPTTFCLRPNRTSMLTGHLGTSPRSCIPDDSSRLSVRPDEGGTKVDRLDNRAE